MTREEYIRISEEYRDPYQAWIREKEIRREPEELLIPGGYSLFTCSGCVTDPGLMSALREYGAFEGGFDFIYTDEDEREGDGRRHDPFFKPDYSPDTLESFYYPGGLTIVSDHLSEMVSGEGRYEKGSLEFLRECGLRAGKPLHIPEVLCHALEHKDYTYSGGEVLTSGVPADAGVSVVILSKDHPAVLKTCVEGLMKASAAEGIRTECIVIDNGSSAENTESYRELSEVFKFTYVREEREFIYSALCNRGAELTHFPFLLFLNDDIEVPEGTAFLSKMVREAAKRTTGAVGVKLLYPGGKKIQHCGITLLRSGASHKLAGYEDDRSYFRGVNRIKRNVLAVTGACLMTERRKFEEAGGFDESFAVSYTDVQLCSALIEKGYYNVCLNDIYLIHHESLSRQADAGDRIKYLRLKEERERWYERYGGLFKKGDPWYSVNLTETGLDYSVNMPSAGDRVPFYRSLPGEGGNEPGVQGCRVKDDPRGKKVLWSLDYFGKRSSDAQGNEDFLEISGWAFVKGEPGYLYDVSVSLKDGEREYLFKAGRTVREDVPEVFSGEKDLMLSGFSVKISSGCFEHDISKESVAIVLTKKGIFGRIKGYIKKYEP